MDEKDLLIEQLDKARAAMRELISGIDPQAEIYPSWDLKCVLAHIAG